MATIRLSAEGQEMDLPDELASSDDLLITALTPFYPQLAGATITRKQEGERLVVEIAKQAGHKGAYGFAARAIAALEKAPERMNPAVELAARLDAGRGPRTVAELLRMRGEIDRAIVEGEAEARRVREMSERLSKARPVACSRVPLGF